MKVSAFAKAAVDGNDRENYLRAASMGRRARSDAPYL